MNLFYLIRTVLREIFDEAAYQRFCAREQIGYGRESYAKFLDEKASSARSKIRCC